MLGGMVGAISLALGGCQLDVLMIRIVWTWVFVNLGFVDWPQAIRAS